MKLGQSKRKKEITYLHKGILKIGLLFRKYNIYLCQEQRICWRKLSLEYAKSNFLVLFWRSIHRVPLGGLIITIIEIVYVFEKL